MRSVRNRLTLTASTGLVAVVLMALVIASLACERSERKQRAGTPGDPYVIGMSQCNLGEPWRVQMNEDIKSAAAKHPNLRVIFKDAPNDSLVQRAQVEELVAQGVDALIISPKEAAPLTAPVAAAWAITAGWVRTVGQVTAVVMGRVVTRLSAPIMDHTNGLCPCASTHGWKWSEIHSAEKPASWARWACSSNSCGEYSSLDKK